MKTVNRFALLFAAVPALAWAQQQVTIVTSFPKELTSAYQRDFEKRNPGVKVEILNKATPAGVAYVRETRPGERPDVFWASAPDAFEVLAKEGLLTKYDPGIKGIPNKIGNYPINDPQGFYRGQALAGYGIMWNTRYLAARKLPAPREWADLAKPVYFSHVSTSSPSRSGTTHLTMETILQGEGWTKGWEQILRICGNSAAITERSFGVPDGVSNGQFGIGLVIDFLGLAPKNSGFPVEFVYPSVTAIVPANIGLVNGAKNAELGRRFIHYSLSPEGQALLLEKAISRLPVLPETYKSAPAGYPNPYAGNIKAKVNFDSELAESRYYVVSSVFDHAITFRHKELVVATRAILEAERRLAAKPSAQGAQRLAEAKAVAYTPVVDESKVRDKEFLALFSDTKRDAARTKRVTALEEHWANEAKKNYARAAELASEAGRLAR
ncbi:MAG: extracellular solute-binding protein [Burkholderiales bacterium]|nr:extracellular solute-binding protein [Burkholderiales bacterium]